MADVNIINPGLADILSRTDPNGDIAPIIEVAERLSPIMQDAVYEECNDGTKHQRTIRAGIPEPAFRMYNQGVQPSKSQTVQVSDTTGMIEDYGEVDKSLADLKGRAARFRATETIAKIQGFNQFVAHNMIYGNTDVDPQGFMGIEPRLSDPTAASGRQIVDAGGSGANLTSIYMVTWGGQGCQLLYPEGSAVGFQHHDKGEQTKELPGGKMMEIYRDHYKWDIGLTVGDWRSMSRVANIDVTGLKKDAATGADLLDLLVDGEELIDNDARMFVDAEGNVIEGTTVIYVSRTIAKFLRKQALNKHNVNLTVEEVGGKRVTMWGDYMVRRLDAILDNEAQVPFA